MRVLATPSVLLIGLGVQGRRHARVIERATGGHLAATVDPASAGLPGVAHFRSVEDALSRIRVDAAVVATPIASHRPLAAALLERGIPTLVEKPLAASAADAGALVELSERTGTLLAVGHVERFNPCVQLVAAMLAKGTIGRPVACSFRRVGLPPARPPDFDVVSDLAVHDLDAFSVLVPGSTTLAGASGWHGPGGLVESAHLLTVRQDVHALIEVNWRTPVRLRRFTVTTDECLVEVDYTTQAVDVVEASEVADLEEFGAFRSHYGAARRTHLEGRVAEPLADQDAAFLSAVGGEPVPGLALGTDGLAAVRVAEEASAAISLHQLAPVSP